MPPSRSQPEFFVDRSLARTHLEVFGERDQDVTDVEWLELCGREGWVVLTMDRRIRYRRAEIAAIRRHRVQAFVLTSGNLTAAAGERPLDRIRPERPDKDIHQGHKPTK